jgi:uncharacterized protein (TIGR02996 family)
MSDTVAALRAAALAAPADRTVRLVLADALDESGDAPRAEFVRAQVELERASAEDPRRTELSARCAELFAEHWTSWWAPVCAAVGLPPPHVPGTGLRARLVRRFTGDAREPGAPYTAHPSVPSVSVPEPRVVAHFRAGFPELLHFPAEPPRDLGRWAAAVPLYRLSWVGTLADTDDWNALDHPALAGLGELALERFPAGAAERAARFAPLAGLARLSIGPTNPMSGAVVAAVRNPIWSELRELDLMRTADPNAVRALARSCALERLEELSFGIAEVPGQASLPGVGGALGAAIGGMLTALFATLQLPPGPITGADWSAALAELGRSPVAPRLKRLVVREVEPGFPNRAARALLRALPPGSARAVLEQRARARVGGRAARGARGTAPTAARPVERPGAGGTGRAVRRPTRADVTRATPPAARALRACRSPVRYSPPSAGGRTARAAARRPTRRSSSRRTPPGTPTSRPASACSSTRHR